MDLAEQFIACRVRFHGLSNGKFQVSVWPGDNQLKVISSNVKRLGNDYCT